jgi:hypothetical protein
MLRILENGKAISLKEQDKRVSAKKSNENVGRPVDFTRPAVEPRAKYPGLKAPKVKKNGPQ